MPETAFVDASARSLTAAVCAIGIEWRNGVRMPVGFRTIQARLDVVGDGGSATILASR